MFIAKRPRSSFPHVASNKTINAIRWRRQWHLDTFVIPEGFGARLVVGALHVEGNVTAHVTWRNGIELSIPCSSPHKQPSPSHSRSSSAFSSSSSLTSLTNTSIATTTATTPSSSSSSSSFRFHAALVLDTEARNDECALSLDTYCIEQSSSSSPMTVYE